MVQGFQDCSGERLGVPKCPEKSRYDPRKLQPLQFENDGRPVDQLGRLARNLQPLLTGRKSEGRTI